MSTSSSYDWDVCIVDGYHFDIPSTALVHSLLQRCAVVCNPYRSEQQSRMYIQSIIAYICSVLPHTPVRPTTWQRLIRYFGL